LLPLVFLHANLVWLIFFCVSLMALYVQTSVSLMIPKKRQKSFVDHILISLLDSGTRSFALRPRTAASSCPTPYEWDNVNGNKIFVRDCYQSLAGAILRDAGLLEPLPEFTPGVICKPRKRCWTILGLVGYPWCSSLVLIL
jgi:hypothetical protein